MSIGFMNWNGLYVTEILNKYISSAVTSGINLLEHFLLLFSKGKYLQSNDSADGSYIYFRAFNSYGVSSAIYLWFRYIHFL